MILDSKQIKLEDMAESMRHIVEEENADAHDNISHESASQPRAEQLKKLRSKPVISSKKSLQNAKTKGFKKELEKFFI